MPPKLGWSLRRDDLDSMTYRDKDAHYISFYSCSRSQYDMNSPLFTCNFLQRAAEFKRGIDSDEKNKSATRRRREVERKEESRCLGQASFLYY